MLQLKLQYFSPLMQRAYSLGKPLILGKIEGRRRRGQHKMRWLNGITDSTDMSLNKLRKIVGFPGGSDGKESASSAEDPGLSPGREDPLEKGIATHSSILTMENSMDRGAWQSTIHGATKSQTQLSDFHSLLSLSGRL